MKEKKKFGLESQAYVAPRAESVEMCNEGLLCASVIPPHIDGGPENFTRNTISNGWL